MAASHHVNHPLPGADSTLLISAHPCMPSLLPMQSTASAQRCLHAQASDAAQRAFARKELGWASDPVPPPATKHEAVGLAELVEAASKAGAAIGTEAERAAHAARHAALQARARKVMQKGSKQVSRVKRWLTKPSFTRHPAACVWTANA